MDMKIINKSCEVKVTHKVRRHSQSLDYFGYGRRRTYGLRNTNDRGPVAQLKKWQNEYHLSYRIIETLSGYGERNDSRHRTLLMHSFSQGFHCLWIGLLQ